MEEEENNINKQQSQENSRQIGRLSSLSLAINNHNNSIEESKNNSVYYSP